MHQQNNESLSKPTQTLQRLLRSSLIEFTAPVSHPIEEQRMRWTMFDNCNTWFDHWEENLVDLGFGTWASGNSDVKVDVPDNQKACILNLDETTITLDGSKSWRGGRPNISFIDWGLPVIGLVPSKTSQSIIIIIGSNALGEVIPPLFKFSTNAKNEDCECIWLETVNNLSRVRGKVCAYIVQKNECWFSFFSPFIELCTFLNILCGYNW